MILVGMGFCEKTIRCNKMINKIRHAGGGGGEEATI